MSSWHRNNPEAYGAMINRGIAKKHFPRTFIKSEDELLCDLDGMECTESGRKLHELMREDAFEFIQSEEADRYGSQIDEIMDQDR